MALAPAQRADLAARTAANRRRLADLLEGLDPAGWATPSLCTGWSVRVLAGHMLLLPEVPFRVVLVQAVRHRGFDAALDQLSRRLAERSTTELVGALRRRADSTAAPPGLGPLSPFTEACIHLRDAARPLGSAVTPPAEDWRTVLDFLVTPGARRGFVPRGRLSGLALHASDLGWRHGEGAELRGSAEALAMAMAGRRDALDELTGPGVALLAGRVAVPST